MFPSCDWSIRLSTSLLLCSTFLAVFTLSSHVHRIFFLCCQGWCEYHALPPSCNLGTNENDCEGWTRRQWSTCQTEGNFFFVSLKCFHANTETQLCWIAFPYNCCSSNNSTIVPFTNIRGQLHESFQIFKGHFLCKITTVTSFLQLNLCIKSPPKPICVGLQIDFNITSQLLRYHVQQILDV